jgi:hypothetical protein
MTQKSARVISLFEVKNDLFTAEKQYQKKGFGEIL